MDSVFLEVAVSCQQYIVSVSCLMKHGDQVIVASDSRAPPPATLAQTFINVKGSPLGTGGILADYTGVQLAEQKLQRVYIARDHQHCALITVYFAVLL